MQKEHKEQAMISIFMPPLMASENNFTFTFTLLFIKSDKKLELVGSEI